MAAFSRLQLAKALIEYDNDQLPPDEPPRRAEESAIFASLRRNLPSRQPLRQRNTDYLGVGLPSESSLHVEGYGGARGTVSTRGSLFDPSDRKSASSLDVLRNPFGRDSTIEGAPMDVGDGIEVDLASWGLDALVDKGKGKKLQREESTASHLPNPHSPIQLHDSPRRMRPSATARTMSMGNIPFSGSVSREDLNLGAGGAFLDAEASVTPPATLNARRRSVGSPLDYADVHPSDPALASHRRKASGHILIDSIPVTPPLHAIPFPPGGTPSPEELEHGELAYDEPEQEQGYFNVVPPSPNHASRFDPRAAPRDRVASSSSTQMLDQYSPLAEDSASIMMGHSSIPGRDRPYSRLELMRPKVLIMPSPLQSSAGPTPETPQSGGREGFQITADGPPLPAGARTGARGSAISLLSPTSVSPQGSGSDYFSPNPRANLTLSQLTFRNTLMVDGQRDVAYKDIDDHLRWASEDGEQVELPEIQPPTLAVVDVDAGDADEFEQNKKQDKRAPGKLYGRSLIDDLQARKVEMKSKQRVFTGDQRPSMMARTPMKRSSTLIDPESLKQRPISTMVRGESSQTMGENGLTRRNSAHAKTLINFDDEIPGAPRGGGHLTVDNQPAMSKTRSVFGVDTIWEREMVKLKEIEAQEKADEEDRLRRDTEEAGGRKKGKGKRKGRTDEVPRLSSPLEQALPPSSSRSQDPITPSSSAARQSKARVLRAPPPPVDGDESEEDEASDSSSVAGRMAAQAKPNGWYSDEEGDGPSRRTGTGPKYANLPPRLRALQQQDEQQKYQHDQHEDEDSEEDLPLVATIGRAAQRATRTDLAGTQLGGDTSDEEVPLSQLLDKTKLKLPSPTFGGFGSNSAQKSMSHNDDEDDQPLGLRASRLMSPSHSQVLSSQGGGGGGGDDEDDVPLALHPEQMRRSQFMMAAQQQAQQQMMMQAAAAQMQMQQSMMFGAPSIMSAPFFAPPMAPAMMIPPQMPATPPPMPDTAKLTRVDKWRHDVAVEEER